ncbi:MAG: hypothetical protein Kapaf2KO_13120 [Candidatus Kapaibacteriales bacterium]
MALKLPEINKTSNAWRFPIYLILGLVIGFLQVVFGDTLAVSDVTPDILLVLVVWICFAEQRWVATVFGFLLGIMFDIISNDVMGLNAFAKTIGAFVGSTLLIYSEKEGRFYTRFKFMLVLVIASLLHNIIYFFFSLRPTEIDLLDFLLYKSGYFTLYTAIFGIIALLLSPPKSIERDDEWD